MKSYKLLKEGIAALVCLVLFIMFLSYAADRIQGLDENSYTEDGHNKSMSILIKK